MSFLDSLIGYFSGDPYEKLPGSILGHFRCENTYTAETDCGFKVKYRVRCIVKKVNHDEFKKARMLEESNQQRLAREWHEQVFLPSFKALRCSFRYLAIWNGVDYGNPCLCRIAKDKKEEAVFFDFNCHRLMDDLDTVPPLQKNGCEVGEAFIEILRDPDAEEYRTLLMENRHLMQVRGVTSVENSPAFRQHEEAMVIGVKARYLELRQQFLLDHSNQKHQGKVVTVKTSLVGNILEFSWEFSGQGCRTLRAYRKEDGFSLGSHHPNANGVVILETQNICSKSVQGLEEGKEYFFSFILSQDDPGIPPAILDTLRFSIRVPTKDEHLRVERMIEKSKVPPPIDPKREKINRAVQALTSMMEFDEEFSEIESSLAARIKSKKYPKDVEEQKLSDLAEAAKFIKHEADENGTAG